MPHIYSGSYGLGSRDFRPEHIIGAYEFATAGRARKDGKTAADGVSFFVLGIDHPYAVIGDEMPSLLPEGAVAVRFHSIGGWGAITTGKNLGAILGDLNDLLYERDGLVDDKGNPKEVIHVSANPKYGSEKKGAPTSYFMVAAKDRIRVNCDLRHVTDRSLLRSEGVHPHQSAGRHPGRRKPGLGVGCRRRARVGEPARCGRASRSSRRTFASSRCRALKSRARQRTAPICNCACRATRSSAPSLPSAPAAGVRHHAGAVSRRRMKQYVKKFGKLGEAVVNSNMEVMIAGLRAREGNRNRRNGRGRQVFAARTAAAADPRDGHCRRRRAAPLADAVPHCLPRDRMPVRRSRRIDAFDAEFRASFGYDQPATPLAAMGVIAAATGDTASKYVARRETPLYIPENCTQCMECISVCPDTALPNTSQDLGTVLTMAVSRYVGDAGERTKMMAKLPEIEKQTRQRMVAEMKTGTPLPKIIREVTESVDGFSTEAKTQFYSIIDKVPMAYQKVNAIFSSPERKAPGTGGIFSIFVSDLCKGCAACVTACGDHEALKMVQETNEVNAEHETGTAFLNLLPDTSQKYLGLFNAANPADSKTATLRNMLMVRRNYDALVSGDGACAGCGEKSVLRSIAAVTEAYMRPVYHAKSDRFVAKAGDLEKNGVAKLAALKESDPDEYDAAAAGDRAPRSWASAASRWKTRSRASPRTKQRTARSPTRRWWRRSPRCC